MNGGKKCGVVGMVDGGWYNNIIPGSTFYCFLI